MNFYFMNFLNETALIYKIKALRILKNSTKAIAESNKFRLRYNESMAKNFHLTFENILNAPVPVEIADL